MRTAIDTNLISAIWSAESAAVRISDFLDEAARRGGMAISPVVYVELRAHPSASEEFVNRFLEKMEIIVDWSLERAIWELTAERFEQYIRRRRRQGPPEPSRCPADFMVGAHALLRADRLATLDQRRYRADFPELMLAEI